MGETFEKRQRHRRQQQQRQEKAQQKKDRAADKSARNEDGSPAPKGAPIVERDVEGAPIDLGRPDQGYGGGSGDR